MKYALYIKYGYTTPFVLASLDWDTLLDAVQDFQKRSTGLEFGHMIVKYDPNEELPESRP